MALRSFSPDCRQGFPGTTFVFYIVVRTYFRSDQNIFVRNGLMHSSSREPGNVLSEWDPRPVGSACRDCLYSNVRDIARRYRRGVRGQHCQVSHLVASHHRLAQIRTVDVPVYTREFLHRHSVFSAYRPILGCSLLYASLLFCTPNVLPCLHEAAHLVLSLLSVLSVTGAPPLAAALTETAMATMPLDTLDKLGLHIHQILVDNDAVIGESAGDIVEYTTTITNNGTTTLSNLSVTGTLGDGFNCVPNLAENLELSPGEIVICTSVAEVRAAISCAGTCPMLSSARTRYDCERSNVGKFAYCVYPLFCSLQELFAPGLVAYSIAFGCHRLRIRSIALASSAIPLLNQPCVHAIELGETTPS